MLCRSLYKIFIIGNFTCGEYILVLRLTSELVELRTGYANPIPLRFARGVGSWWVPIQKGLLNADLFVLAPATGIEPITTP